MKKELQEKLDKSKSRMKIFRKIMIGLDILALIILILQIISRSISYSSYVLLILCNAIVFSIEPNEKDIEK